MLHALIHGKLDPTVTDPHRREDTLTSIVFGTLAMVDAWETMARWLRVDVPASAPTVHTECWFWPRLAGAVEPDVVMRLGDVLVVVEAKYRSGRNDLVLEDPEDDKPVDQIVRQHKAVSPPHDSRMSYPEALERAVRECRIVQAFVVDGRSIRKARKEHRESKDRLPPDARLNLVTWQALYKTLLDSSSRWSTDLRAYLKLAGLDTFQGIRSPMQPADGAQAISDWRPYVSRRAVVGLRAAVATLAAEPAVVELCRWRARDSVGNTSR